MCRVSVVKGDELLAYSFPPPHPFNGARAVRFWERLAGMRLGEALLEPQRADEEVVELFHDKALVHFVRQASTLGYGYLDQGDTPAFKGVLEAAEFAVGSTLECVEGVADGRMDHAFNPVGGLHHARRDASAGFCVFNDIGVAIEVLRKTGVKRILYVDIDVHHGDGVFYSYEEDPDLFDFDVHEDGDFIYPGTGRAAETGEGGAKGTKVNIELRPGEGDERIRGIVAKLEDFARWARPDFVILQCGADCMAGDPLGGLNFSHAWHSEVARVLHEVSHRSCEGRFVALGGGGYDPDNCASAWTSVVKEMVRKPNA